MFVFCFKKISLNRHGNISQLFYFLYCLYNNASKENIHLTSRDRNFQCMFIFYLKYIHQTKMFTLLYLDISSIFLINNRIKKNEQYNN